MAPIKVYGHPASSNTDRVQLILSMADVDYESVLVKLEAGEQKGPEYKARSPWAKVPAIALPDGTNICESRAIARYVAAKHLPALLPAADDLVAQARHAEAASAEQGYFDRPVSLLGFERYVKAYIGLPVDDKAIEESRAAVKAHFEVLDGILAKRPYVAGDALGLVDVFYLPHMQRLVLSDEWGLVEAWPHVEAWWKRCRENERARKYLDSMPTIETMKKSK